MCDNTLDKKFGQLSPNKGCLNPPPPFSCADFEPSPVDLVKVDHPYIG